MKDDELLHKWINNELSQAELDVFKKRPEYDSLVEIFANTDQLKGPELQSEKVLTAILKEEKHKKIVDLPKRQQGNRRWMLLMAAAVGLLLIGVFIFGSQSQMQSYQTLAAQQQDGKLPDQSAFILNADSKLEFDSQSWKDQRKVNLQGEAYFEVEKGSSFEVNTPQGAVVVLGTKFNVRSRRKSFVVECYEGMVEVRNKEGKKIAQLSKHQALRHIQGSSPTTLQLNQEQQASWTTGIIQFKKEKLGEVLRELERQFGIKIKSTDIDLEELLTCNFQTKDLELALKTSLNPLGISYKIVNPKLVEISKK